MVHGCQCAARKAVWRNTLQLVGYPSTKTNLLSKRQGAAALRLGGQKVKGWRRPQRTGQTRDRSQDTSAMQHQFQETRPLYTGLRVRAHVPPRTCHTPGTEEHQAPSGQGREEKKLRQRMLSPSWEKCCPAGSTCTKSFFYYHGQQEPSTHAQNNPKWWLPGPV